MRPFRGPEDGRSHVGMEDWHGGAQQNQPEVSYHGIHLALTCHLRRLCCDPAIIASGDRCRTPYLLVGAFLALAIDKNGRECSGAWGGWLLGSRRPVAAGIAGTR